MQIKVTTPPTAEPVSLEEAKVHLVLSESFTEDDAYVTSLIRTARRRVEKWLGLSVMTQEITLNLDMEEAIPPIWIPRPPFQSLTSFTIYDQDNAATTPDSDKYRLVDTHPARLLYGINNSYTLHLRERAAVLVYRAGYATKFTASASTDVLTAVDHPYSDGDAVRLYLSGNEYSSLPGGLAEETTYYARDVSGDTLKLAATSGGSAIDLTTDGSGSFYLGVVPEEIREMILIEVARLYENRGEEGKVSGLSDMTMSLGEDLRYDYL